MSVGNVTKSSDCIFKFKAVPARLMLLQKNVMCCFCVGDLMTVKWLEITLSVGTNELPWNS